MRTYDEEDIEELRAEPWMLDLLKINPEYVYWGPHEDYMSKDGDGWDARVLLSNWNAFAWQLNELNECIHFYFSVIRDSRDCFACDCTGYNPATKAIADGFYNFSNRKEGWNDKITQDEVQALVDANRLYDLTHEFVVGKGWCRKEDKPIPTAEEVNAWQRGRGLGHDAINRFILIETRAKRLGVWGKCETCGGSGSIYISEKAHVKLTLWMLHPRKGCSRGVEISNIEQADLPAIYRWLREAADRNAARFAKIPKEEV